MGRIASWVRVFCVIGTFFAVGVLQAQTSTPTYTLTYTPTFTFTRTGSPTSTKTPTPTQTPTPTSTRTNTSTNTYTPTFTRSLTPTPTVTWTFTSTGSPVFGTATPTATFTPTFTASFTPTVTGTPFVGTPTPTFTRTSTFTQTPTHTPTPVSTTYCRVVDDLEDGNLTTFGGGAWTAYTWGTAASTGLSVVAGGANGTSYSLMFSGSGASVDGQNGWDAAAALSPGVTDLSSGLVGVSFWIRSSVPMTLQAGFVSQVQPDGDFWAATFTSSTAWSQVTLPLSAFSQAGWGVVTPLHYALTQVLGVGWEPQNLDGSPATVWVDEICLTSAGTPATPTWTPTNTKTPENTPTPGGAVPGWKDPVTQVAGAIGCTTTVVNQVRQLQIEPFTSYVIMRLTVHCGCTVQQIMALRLNLGWDQISAYYGVPWQTLVSEVLAMTAALPREAAPPNNILRAAVNDPAVVNPYPPAAPVPTEQLVLLPPYQEVCP